MCVRSSVPKFDPEKLYFFYVILREISNVVQCYLENQKHLENQNQNKIKIKIVVSII